MSLAPLVFEIAVCSCGDCPEEPSNVLPLLATSPVGDGLSEVLPRLTFDLSNN